MVEELHEEEGDLLSPFDRQPEIRLTGIYEVVEEKCASEVVNFLLAVYHFDKLQKEKEEEKNIPIEFIVSTHGGVASEMFAIYDCVRMVREDTPIHTFGVGKVMSSGLLLLAAGTKGKRRIGKNTRLMFHDVITGQEGPLFELKDGLKETEVVRNMYLNALLEETGLPAKKLDKMLSQRRNHYFSAEDAVELGFADIIV